MIYQTYKDDIKRREEEVIPGTYDIVFKKLFINVERLVEEVITNIDNTITKEDMKGRKIISNELLRENIEEKGKVCDLIIEIENKIINIEMNRVLYKKIKERNNNYAAKIQSLYEDKYVIQINIDDFSAYDNKTSLIKFQMMSDQDYIDERFIVKYHVNLEVTKNKYYNKEELTRLEKILLMLKLVKREELKSLSKGDNLMERMYKELNNMSKRKESLLSYSKHELEMEGFKELFKKQGLEEGKAEGIKEGIEEGKKEGIKEGSKNKMIEIAKNLLSMNMKIEDISKATNLSIDDINNLN